jgi:hypothetical protein
MLAHLIDCDICGIYHSPAEDCREVVERTIKKKDAQIKSLTEEIDYLRDNDIFNPYNMEGP